MLYSAKRASLLELLIQKNILASVKCIFYGVLAWALCIRTRTVLLYGPATKSKNSKVYFSNLLWPSCLNTGLSPMVQLQKLQKIVYFVK